MKANTKTIRIGRYVFTLKMAIKDDNEVRSVRFYFDDDLHRDMTEKELELGQAYQQDIMSGKYDEYIKNTQMDIVR